MGIWDMGDMEYSGYGIWGYRIWDMGDMGYGKCGIWGMGTWDISYGILAIWNMDK